MARNNWTTNDIEFLRNYYPGKGPKYVAQYLCKSYPSVKSKARAMGIKYLNRRRLSEEAKKYIKKHYANTRTIDISRVICFSMYTIYNYASTVGLKKSAEFLASPQSGILTKGHIRGKQTQFIKGHTPENKGKKMPAEIRKKVELTFFTKGHLPANTLYDGAITIRKDKKGTMQKYIRISKAKWDTLSRVVWKQENGKIPRGYNIVFKNGDTMNCTIDNLEMISNAELMQRNTCQNYPEPLRKLIQIKGVLSRQINKNNHE